MLLVHYQNGGFPSNPPVRHYRKIEIKVKKSIVDNHRRIFFHETSGNATLNIKQCCTVESMAKHNPELPVHVYLSSGERPQPLDPCPDHVLRHYANIKTELVDNSRYFTETRLHDWYESGVWRWSPSSVSHLSQHIRLVTIYKRGGLYMDLDYVGLKRLDEEKFFRKNVLFVDSDDKRMLSNGIFHFHAGHPFIDEVTQLLESDYKSEEFSVFGSKIYSDVYGEMCVPPELSNKTSDSRVKSYCSGIKLLAAKHFFPIRSSMWRTYYDDATPESVAALNGSYAARVWNLPESNGHMPIRFGTKQLYAVLAEEHCPLTAASHSKWN